MNTNAYASTARTMSVAQARPDARAAFIRKTYMHLAGAILLFAGLEAVLLNSPFAPAFVRLIAGAPYGWLMVLGAFVVTGWMARGMAHGATSPGMQYLGLGAYVVAQAIIFVPILYIATHYTSPEVIPTAAGLTLALFLGLTFVAFTSGQDFSFLRGILCMGGFIALGLIGCSILFGFSLGLYFSAAMVGLASASILYDTSNIIRYYRTNQHVGAALELFASVALLFWYILRILMKLNRR